MFDLERVYKISNIIAVALSLVLIGVCWTTTLSLWYIVLTLSLPTILFLCAVFGALVWSFWLTKE